MTKTRATYTDSDVVRWISVFLEDVEILKESIALGDTGRGQDFVSLVQHHEYLALARIACGELPEALHEFSSAAEAWVQLLTAVVNGLDIDPGLVPRSAGGFLLAAASGDEPCIIRLAQVHAKVVPTLETRQHARYDVTVRNLALRDIEAARRSWAVVTEPGTGAWGWAAAVDAIVTCDEAGFRESMAEVEDWWSSRVRDEHLQKYPDAVCDHYAFGWLRLAERAWGKRPDFIVGNIPPQLFETRP